MDDSRPFHQSANVQYDPTGNRDPQGTHVTIARVNPDGTYRIAIHERTGRVSFVDSVTDAQVYYLPPPAGPGNDL